MILARWMAFAKSQDAWLDVNFGLIIHLFYRGFSLAFPPQSSA